jgi:hypothetical protein
MLFEDNADLSVSHTNTVILCLSIINRNLASGHYQRVSQNISNKYSHIFTAIAEIRNLSQFIFDFNSSYFSMSVDSPILIRITKVNPSYSLLFLNDEFQVRKSDMIPIKASASIFFSSPTYLSCFFLVYHRPLPAVIDHHRLSPTP